MALTTKHELPVIELTQSEFDDLLEYSTSLPTGKTIGKRWKRRVREKSTSVHGGYDEWWMMGEYVEHPDPELVGINWHRIEITENDE